MNSMNNSSTLLIYLYYKEIPHFSTGLATTKLLFSILVLVANIGTALLRFVTIPLMWIQVIAMFEIEMSFKDLTNSIRGLKNYLTVHMFVSEKMGSLNSVKDY